MKRLLKGLLRKNIAIGWSWETNTGKKAQDLGDLFGLKIAFVCSNSDDFVSLHNATYSVAPASEPDAPRKMCNLYSMTKSQDAIRAILGAMTDRTGNLLLCVSKRA